jgi:hypothetical protein
MTGRAPGGEQPPSKGDASRDWVEAWLERYSAEGLAPDHVRMAVARASVLAKFAERSAQQALRRPRRPLLRGWALALAFPVLVGTTGTIIAAESGPGQPFYAVRLAIGNVTLSQAEPARDRGLAGQLDDRLGEARAAAEKGDDQGTQAAIDAYVETLDELTGHGINDPDVLSVLHRHLDTLNQLLSVAPHQAADGLQHALDVAGHASEVTAPPAASSGPHPTPPQNGDGPPSSSRRP